VIFGILGTAETQNFSVLHDFAGGSDGAIPYAPFAGLIRDAEGNLYGTTSTDGSGYSAGTVFKIDASGNETVLYRFGGVPANDGASPESPLLRDGAGNLYGTTYYGGVNSNNGTVFKIDPTGHETILYTFQGGSDGAHPMGNLARDSAGNLYGVTQNGGPSGCTTLGNGCGTVFQMDQFGHEFVRYAFTGTNGDGAYPEGGVIRDASGNLYGTTYEGGAGLGTIFKIGANNAETILHTFSGSDGRYPESVLLADAAGNLYGTATYGGAGNHGDVYELQADGSFSILYSFKDKMDGGLPESGLIADKVGNLYGTSTYGGSGCTFGCGVVYRVNPAREQVLFRFAGSGVATPASTLVGDAEGNLYGVTQSGGNSACANGCGTVFKLNLK
jgi:uncharacterized repeat protein (TIGR03803 family)